MVGAAPRGSYVPAASVQKNKNPKGRPDRNLRKCFLHDKSSQESCQQGTNHSLKSHLNLVQRRTHRGHDFRLAGAGE